MAGMTALSTGTSAKDRCVLGSYLSSSSVVTSSDLQNDDTRAATQSITELNKVAAANQTSLSFLSMEE